MKKLCRSLLFVPFLFAACADSGTGEDGGDTPVPTTPQITYQIGEIHAHDTSYFTQGLEFYGNTLIEGTGLPGKSKLMQLSFPDGKVLKEVKLEDRYFGEGITVLNDTLYQLTWQEHVVHVYTVKDFKKVKEFTLNPEGWGLTNDGKQLIASDGSNNLYYYEPSTFRLLKVQSITENSTPAVNLNELEYVDGFIYANQWQYSYILKIDPATGTVVAKLDLSDLVKRVKQKEPKSEAMNGIAYNKQTKKLYITGKNWPELYEIRF